MRELTMNEITNVYGGCSCYCRKDDKSQCDNIGHASGIQECNDVCTAMGLKMCYC